MADRAKGALWRFGCWVVVTALILAVPATAMRFSSEVAWTTSDFIFAAALIMGVGVAYELAAMRGSAAYRAGAGLALAVAFLTIWLTGAVGIIGNERNGANLMFGAVLAIALIGAIAARFRPAGMSYAMFAAAVAQVLVAVIALTMSWGAGDPSYPWDIIGCTAVFTALWAGAAWLFRIAARSAPARP